MDIVNWMKDHAQAPRWTYETTDKLDPEMTRQLQQFDSILPRLRADPALWKPFLEKRITRVLETALTHEVFFRDWSASTSSAPKLTNLSSFPTTDRVNLAREFWKFVPDNVDYSCMNIYDTSGTTGHAINIPMDPVTVAKYVVFIKEALRQWNVPVAFQPDKVGIVLLGYQDHQVTFPAALTAFAGAGFAKINLNPADWEDPTHPCEYLVTLAPEICTGDPFTFVQLARQFETTGIQPIHPAALVSSATTLQAAAKTYLESFFGCPVIDIYSMTETGPIGYACRQGHGFHLLPPDFHLEVIDGTGHPLPEGQLGELAITGGSNPYFPLVRYRTGDWCTLSSESCPCGDPMPRILQFQGREGGLFRTANGKIINNADVSAVLRQFPLLDFEFRQATDNSCSLRYVPLPGGHQPDLSASITTALNNLFGRATPLMVDLAPELANRPRDQKILPFQSAIKITDLLP